jgi:hypothetical protein
VIRTVRIIRFFDDIRSGVYGADKIVYARDNHLADEAAGMFDTRCAQGLADVKFRKAMEEAFRTQAHPKRNALFDLAWELVIGLHSMRDCAYYEIAEVYEKLVAITEG